MCHLMDPSCPCSLKKTPKKKHPRVIKILHESKSNKDSQSAENRHSADLFKQIKEKHSPVGECKQRFPMPKQRFPKPILTRQNTIHPKPINTNAKQIKLTF